MWGDLKVPFILVVMFLLLLVFAGTRGEPRIVLECRQKGGEYFHTMGCIEVKRIK